MDIRPVNLDFRTIRFPLPAIVSILHRLSGLGLFFLIPCGLWVFQQSLHSNLSFDALKVHCSHLGIRGLIWFALSALIYHFLAGLRHMLMDCHCFESLIQARVTSTCVLALTLSCSGSLGYCLWP